MIYNGEIGSSKCVIEYKNNRTNVIGTKKAFLGYKLGGKSGTNGIFAEWNIENDNLVLSNDKFGFFPIYYTTNGNRVAFSSSITDLLEFDTSRSLDKAAIAVFLRIGSFIGNSTPFKNIKVLPPGAILQFNKGHFSLGSNKIMFGKETNESLNAARCRFGDLFQDSVEKFRDVRCKKFSVPLSGGRDSRHILFALMRSGIKPFSCITVRSQHVKRSADENVQIAKEVCASLGVNHVILEQPVSVLDAEREKNRITNFCSLEHSWILPLSKYLVKEGYEALFDGIGGDVLSAGLFLTKQRLDLYRRGKLEELANEILGPEGYLPKMLTRSAYRQFSRNTAIDVVSSELKVHAKAPNPVGEFFFWNRTRRHISMSSWRILSRNCHVYAPYLDSKVYEFLSSLPAEYLLDHAFHQETITLHFPEYSYLRYETKGIRRKEQNRVFNVGWLSEFLGYFWPSFVRQSMISRLFVYPRILKCFLSPKYCSESWGIYQIPIYLVELGNLV